jgi:hypothetical protein
MNSPDKTTAITTDLAERAMGARRPQFFVGGEQRAAGGEHRRHALSPFFHARPRFASGRLATRYSLTATSTP